MTILLANVLCQRFIIYGLMFTSCAYQTAGLAQNSLIDDPSFQAELTNIQALPFGFAAFCEAQDLKIRADHSATFVIRQSQLCQLRRQASGAPLEGDFILCSNNPRHDSNESLSPPKCFNLPHAIQ